MRIIKRLVHGVPAVAQPSRPPPTHAHAATTAPQVLPVLLAVARGADEPLREYALEQLTQLVGGPGCLLTMCKHWQTLGELAACL